MVTVMLAGFDVAGMQLYRNVYIFMTRRTSQQGKCVTSQAPLPYIASEQGNKVRGP